jgi:hypothetical protein
MKDLRRLRRKILESASTDEQAKREAIQRSIDEDSERITALERIISRVYEDMIAQHITEDNFNRILERSQTEQTTLKNRVMLNRQRLTQQEQEDNTRWLEIIKDYADIQELDAVTLNRLVQKIIIHEDIDGDAVRQTVEIQFNFNDKADKRRIIREK